MSSAVTIAGAAGFGLAVLVAGGASGKASHTFALNVDAYGEVGQTHEAIVVTKANAPVYELAGESVHHFLCTTANGCLGFWPIVPFTGRGRVTAAPAIRGKLGTVARKINGRSVRQVMLGGHPLYTFAQDRLPGVATGNGIRHFGGTWRAFLASGRPASVGGASPGSQNTGTSPTNTATTPTSSTPTYTYPTTPTYTYPSPTGATATPPGW